MRRSYNHITDLDDNWLLYCSKCDDHTLHYEHKEIKTQYNMKCDVCGQFNSE